MEGRMIAIGLGVTLDFLLGDPTNPWHPICLIGNLIAACERTLRAWLPKTKKGELSGGLLCVLFVLFVVGGVSTLCLRLAYALSPSFGVLIEGIFCYFMLAACALKKESMKVYWAFCENNLEKARFAVSMIVGRDTKSLSAEGIQKAAVETVAENTSDGEIAPLFYMLLFGGLGAVLYKAVNTMDSMLGYQNEKYRYFGRVAARLDDVCNWLPSRLAALFLIGTAYLFEAGERIRGKSKENCVFSGKGAWRIWRRDRRNHKSPNSAQTEAACAGALSVQLAGPAWYFGEYYEKPTIGDAIRPVEARDICRANQLLYGSSLLFAAAVLFVLALF